MSVNPYVRVIDILADPDCDHRKILIEVAKHYPAIIVEVVDHALSWQGEVDRFLRRGEKISAIKLWRTETGDGLRESKDAVEARQRELGL